MKPTPDKPMIIVLPFLVLLIASCNKPGPQDTAPAKAAAPSAESHADRSAETHEEGKEREPSDLDRPVEELFNVTCEHGKKTFECDECRYETGVVRAPASLFEGGLLKTVKAMRERIEVPLLLTGEVRFDERRVTHLNTQAEGIIRQVHVALGNKVNQGQPVIEIESVTVGEAQGAYLEAQATLRLARRNYERVAELRKEAISSEKEYLQSKQEFEAAEIRAESALGKLTRLGMAAADAQALSQVSALGRLVLRAPAAGTVLSLHAVPGEVAMTEEPLATIGDNATVWVWADLYERDIALVSRKQQEKKLSATVAVKAYPGEEFPGVVDFISPSMEEASRTVRLRVEVNNPNGRLLAGMFANVKVFLPGEEEGLTLPRSAVLEDEGRLFVFVHHHEEYYVRRPVTTARSWGTNIEVAEGLNGGETVVAEGTFLLKSDVLRSKMGAGCAD
jgi:cobalt-zinc-cadmium efflux system membrane fusion protein